MCSINKLFKGFSLIELMTVVAILGILAAIAIPSYQNYVKKAQLTEVITKLSSLNALAIDYYSQYGTWPTTLLIDGINMPRDTISANGFAFGDNGSGSLVIDNWNYNSFGYLLTPAFGGTEVTIQCGFWVYGSAGEWANLVPTQCNRQL